VSTQKPLAHVQRTSSSVILVVSDQRYRS